MWSHKEDLYAMHGFLGRLSDWNFLYTKDIEKKYKIYLVDYLKNKSLLPKDELQFWGNQFWQCYSAAHRNENGIYLMGYSLGGRLALQAFHAKPRQVKKLILISAGLGRFTAEFAEPFEKRIENDLRWSQKFLNENWDQVMQEWNSQSIFQHSPEPHRDEFNYDRQTLADALRWWSQAYMKTEDQILRMYQEKIILISGEKDIKYTQMYSQVSQEFGIEHHIISEAGHRLIFSHSHKINEILEAIS